MLNKIARQISTKLLKQKVIPIDMFDIYVYGFELIISFTFSVSLIFLIGVVSNNIIPTILFTLAFVLLRSSTGGYHANTYLMCLVVTVFTYCCVVFLAEVFNVPLGGYLVLLIVGTPLLLVFSPIEHPNKPIAEKNRYKFKIFSTLIFSVFTISGAICTLFDNTFADVLFFTLIADLLLMFINNFRKGGKKDETYFNCDY